MLICTSGIFYKEKELNKKPTIKKSLIVQNEGKRTIKRNYNLDVIISVGYRVKCKRGTWFSNEDPSY